MSQFEYLAALISIVIAFGISQMLVAWGRLLRARSRVATYWVHNVWSGLIVLFMILFWWELWQYRALESWTFFTLVWTILNAMFIVLAAYILMPSINDDDVHVDLRSFYYETAPVFFSITAIGMILIDRLGRKTLLTIGSVGYILSLGMVAYGFFIDVHTLTAFFIFAF